MQAVRDSAADFLEKPISLKRLLSTVETVIAGVEGKPNTRSRRSSRPAAVRRPRKKMKANTTQLLPVFEIPEYELTVDFNLPHRDVLLALERLLPHTPHLPQPLGEPGGEALQHGAHPPLYRKVKALGINLEELRAPRLNDKGELIRDDRRDKLLASANAEPNRTAFRRRPSEALVTIPSAR